MKYTISNKSKWKYLYKVMLTTFFYHFLGFVVLLWLYKLTDMGTISKIGAAVLITWFLFFNLPLLILYSNHSKRSVFNSFEINNEVLFILQNRGDKCEFNLEEIESIELYLSPPKYDNRVDFLYFGSYHYTLIKLRNSRSVKISCLLFDESEKVFPSDLIIRKKKTFPLL